MAKTVKVKMRDRWYDPVTRGHKTKEYEREAYVCDRCGEIINPYSRGIRMPNGEVLCSNCFEDPLNENTSWCDKCDREVHTKRYYDLNEHCTVEKCTVCGSILSREYPI